MTKKEHRLQDDVGVFDDFECRSSRAISPEDRDEAHAPEENQISQGNEEATVLVVVSNTDHLSLAHLTFTTRSDLTIGLALTIRSALTID
jgi:hypothetical protein